MTIFDLFAPFVIGFVGSVHCLGMCGPLVLAYSLHIKSHESSPASHGIPSWRSGLLHHLAFHSGRLLSYGFLGALAAGIFHMFALISLLKDFRAGMTVLGGALMLFFALAFLKVFQMPGFLTLHLTAFNPFWRNQAPKLFQSQRLVSRMLLGLAAGFLPCGLSWAMIVKSATTQDVAAGFLTMEAFGLGTVPALFLVGFSASFLSLKVRFLGERIASFSLLVMGLILIFKGGRIFV